MRVVFMGTPDFAVPTLAALIENHEVVGVVTQPDKRKGRGKAMAFTPVKEKALEYDIPVYQPVNSRHPCLSKNQNSHPLHKTYVHLSSTLTEKLIKTDTYSLAIHS